jgi:hypothetical protein
MENEMGTQSHKKPMEPNEAKVVAPQRLTFELEQQCLRVLRCTARALANSPGGLRFKSGTRPWLDALTQSRSDTLLSVQNGGC